jgi:hypothetical protein
METPDPATEPEIAAGDQAELDEDRDLAIDDAADEGQHRLWVRALVPLLQLRTQETDPSPRVQLALDRMIVAACERVGRICRSDLAD